MAKRFGDRWEIVKTLREGGQGFTYLVRDAGYDGQAQFVLKRLKNPHRIDRFKREIGMLSSLSHENILKLVDYNVDGETPYLVTEYCRGGALSDSERFWQGNTRATMALFLGVCEGVVHAHQKGCVHRDLKPANIFLREAAGQPVVGDWGLAFVPTDDRLTHSTEAVGPRLFMAPELADGRTDDIAPAADVYSLGKLLYWLFAVDGRLFDRERHRDERWDLKGKNLDSIAGWNAPNLEHVNHLLDHMIVENPRDRWSLGTVVVMAKRCTKLIEQGASPLEKSVPEVCRFCFQGLYRELPSIGIPSELRMQLDGEGLKVLACTVCGHCQVFSTLHVERDWIKG